MNHILCPSCFAKTLGEEKCCSHGCGDACCFECGTCREDNDPPWHCLGTARVDQHKGNEPKGKP